MMFWYIENSHGLPATGGTPWQFLFFYFLAYLVANATTVVIWGKYRLNFPFIIKN